MKLSMIVYMYSVWLNQVQHVHTSMSPSVYTAVCTCGRASVHGQSHYMEHMLSGRQSVTDMPLAIICPLASALRLTLTETTSHYRFHPSQL